MQILNCELHQKFADKVKVVLKKWSNLGPSEWSFTLKLQKSESSNLMFSFDATISFWFKFTILLNRFPVSLMVAAVFRWSVCTLNISLFASHN